MAVNTKDIKFTGEDGEINPDLEYLKMFGLSEDFACTVDGDILSFEEEEEKKDKNGRPYRRCKAIVTLHGPKGDKCTGYYRKASFDFKKFNAEPGDEMAAYERHVEKMKRYEGSVDLALLVTNAHTFKRSDKGYMSCTLEHVAFLTEPVTASPSPDTVDEATRKAVIQQQQQRVQAAAEPTETAAEASTSASTEDEEDF